MLVCYFCSMSPSSNHWICCPMSPSSSHVNQKIQLQVSWLLLFATSKPILSSMSPEIVFGISFIAGNSLEIFIKFPVTGNCLEIHKHINLCSGAQYRVEPQTTFAERSGSPPKRRTPKIRKFVFCIVVIYALFKRIVELSTKVILLSESFTSKTTNCDAIVKQSFCCENWQIFALIKGWGWLLRSPKASQPLPCFLDSTIIAMKCIERKFTRVQRDHCSQGKFKFQSITFKHAWM